MHAADAVGLPLPQALQKLIDVNGFEEASARALATRWNKMVKNEHENHSKLQKHSPRRRGDTVATARQRYLLEMNPERHVQSAEVSMKRKHTASGQQLQTCIRYVAGSSSCR